MSSVSTENEQKNNKNVADLEEKRLKLEKLIKESQKELKEIKRTQKSKQSKLKNKDKFKCEKCGNTLSTKRQLESHKENVCGKDVWSCHICDETFTSRGHLDKHINKCRKRKCPHCTKFSCANKKQLEEHIKSGKCQKIKFTCDICHKKLLSRNYLKAHYRRKHNLEEEEAKKKAYGTE